MEEIKLADQDEIFDICDPAQLQKKKNRKQWLRGRLKKAGFGVDELTRHHMIKLNEENFMHIAEEQLHNIHVRSPDPNFEKLPLMEKFEDELDLNRSIWSQMEYCNILKPLPVQRVIVPYITRTDCDLLVRAQAGSGKTYTYLLPIIDKILELKGHDQTYAPNNKAPYAVIVAPTKELTGQIAKDATRLIYKNGFKLNVTFAVGEQDSREFNKSRNQGCDILVTTPGKLWEFFLNKKSGHLQTFLLPDNIKFVVLDEADLLADDRKTKEKNDGPGSFKDIMHNFIVEYLTKKIGKWDFRVLQFGATNMQKNVMRNLVTNDNYLEIQVGKEQPVRTVIQSFLQINSEHQKYDRLNDLVEHLSEEYATARQELGYEDTTRRFYKTIIFVNEKRASDRLAHWLIYQGFAAQSINSDRSSQQRFAAVQDMLEDKIDILVASSGVLARGMNFPGIEFVINYDFPLKLEEYNHRVSRVGRIGNLGRSVTFFNPKENYSVAPILIKGCIENEQTIPPVLEDCANHYFQSNDANCYSRGKYIPRSPLHNIRNNGRRPTSLSSDYSSSDSSYRQPSPTYY